MKPEQLAYILFYVSYHTKGFDSGDCHTLAKAAASKCIKDLPK
jgi:hypothetical protein